VAIVGENGAGKSTLVHLLLRFDDPQQGIITVDGTDIKDVSVTSLRQHIGMVQQNVLLLNASVRENILFGQPEADMEQVRQAAQNAHALDFIDQLPDGFDTLIGDQGVKLSGGQKQRLSLARVLLKKPPILILDEATAMFDPEGEKNFIRRCHDLLHQCTVILITHRPASLQLADRVLRMEDGRLQAVSKKAVQSASL
jgi:ABC-type bacteriocin/lantibiotic exporter with double-glycine peptidase domain